MVQGAKSSQRARYPIWKVVRSIVSPNALKIWILRRRGTVGRRVRIGPGAVIASDQVTIGDDVQIGFGTIIRSNQLSIGSSTTIGAMCYLDCPRISIGHDTRVRENVYLGGLTTTRSSIAIGDMVTIFQFTVMNAAEPITIGDRVGIGGKCSLFTHGSWHSMFKGYPVAFGPITIEDDVWLPWEVFIMPGVTVGRGATVAARSLLLHDVSPGTLVAGAPAKQVKGPPDYPRIPPDDELRTMLWKVVDEFVEESKATGMEVRQMTGNDFRIDEFGKGNVTSVRLLTIAGPDGLVGLRSFGTATLTDAIVTVDRLVPGIQSMIDGLPPSWFILDLDQGSVRGDQGVRFVEFVRRYGVRIPGRGSRPR